MGVPRLEAPEVASGRRASVPVPGARDGAMRRLLAAADALAVLIATVLALTIPGSPPRGHVIAWAPAAVPLMIVLFKLYGLYDRDVKRISHSTVDDLPWLIHAVMIGTLLFWLYARYGPLRQLALLQVLMLGSAMVALVTAGRFAARSSAGRLIGRERVLFVGGGRQAERLASKLASHPEYHLEIVGSLHGPEFVPNGSELVPGPILGTLDELDRVAVELGVTRVMLSRDLPATELERLLRHCRKLALKVSLLPTLADLLGPGVVVDDVEGMTVLGVNPPWLPRSSRAIKRAVDLVVAGALLVALAPVLLLVAVAIKLESRGPVLFTQERVGRAGKRFRLLKFRSMAADAEGRRAELLASSADPNWLLLEHDPRITRVGERLRRFSLDELPQLWNVLRGDMSMVGPRPLIPAEDERVTGWGRGRLDLTPGITGYWQVLGRTRIPFEEMVKLDYLYVMNWSLWEDVRLMLRTLPAVIGGRGAN